jgi:dihydroorotate dehydrogenase (NAD+) catalytic subunit
MDDSPVELGLSSPWMNAAGFMGYLPQHLAGQAFTPGAFVTNPVSLLPRSPAHNHGVVAYPGGFLLHTGHPNPGLKSVIKSYAHKWRNLVMPVWVYLMVTTTYDCQQMVLELEGLENVTALELGLPPGMSLKKQVEIIQSAVGELPVFVSLPLDEVDRNLVDQLPALGEVGVVLTAPRGVIKKDGRTLSGRLFGPSLYPQMMTALSRLRGAGLPVVAACGIFSIEQGQGALSSGASAIQVDGWCWQF